MKTGRPAALCGDFNSEFSSPEHAYLRKSGFTDTMAGMPDEKKPSWDNLSPFIQGHNFRFPNRRIDLILANKEFLNIHAPILVAIAFNKPTSSGDSQNSIFPSDHYGIVGEFR
jgi:endonuclease/exonuclease/phosphatase family metal-dependent hydrolase